MLVQLYDVLLQYPGGLLDPHLVLADEVPDGGVAALSSFVRKAREKASYKLLFSDPQGLLLTIFRALM